MNWNWENKEVQDHFETLEFWVWRTQDSYELTYGNSNCENVFFQHTVLLHGGVIFKSARKHMFRNFLWRWKTTDVYLRMRHLDVSLQKFFICKSCEWMWIGIQSHWITFSHIDGFTFLMAYSVFQAAIVLVAIEQTKGH